MTGAVVVLGVMVALVPIVTTNLTALGIGPMPLLYDVLELPRFLLSTLGALAVIALWAWGARRSGTALRSNPALLALAALALIAVLSTAFAADWRFSVLGQSERLEGAATWVVYALLFFVALQVVRGTRDLQALSYALVIPSALLALHGLAQTLGWDPFSYVLESPGFDTRRAFATSGNPNFLAGLLVLALPIAVGLAARAARPARSWWLWSCAGVIAAALFATFTRGAWLAAAFEILALALVFRRGVATLGRRGATALAGCALAVVALAAATFGRGGETDVVARLTDILAGSSAERVLAWEAAARAAAARPLLGYGPDSFLAAFRLHRPDAYAAQFGAGGTINNAHNWPLNTAATLGPAAAVLLVFAIVWVLVRAGRVVWAADSRDGSVALYATVWVGCLGYAVHMLFNVAVHGVTTPFWILLGALAVPVSGNVALRLAPRTASFAAVATAAVLAVSLVAGASLLAADHAYLASRVAFRQGGGDPVALAARAVRLNSLSVKYARGHAEVLAEPYIRQPDAGASVLAPADAAFMRATAAHPSDYATRAWHAALLATAQTRAQGTPGTARGVATRASGLDRQAAQVAPLSRGGTDAAAISLALTVPALP